MAAPTGPGRSEHDRPPMPGTPEYDWLYGSAPEATEDQVTRPMPATSGRADPTRVLPALDRPTPTHPRPTRSADTTTPVAPRMRAAAPARQRRFRTWWIVALVICWVVFLLAVPLWAWSRVDKVSAFPASGRPGDQPGTNYLLVGSDSRAGLSRQERLDLGTGNAGGQRTDTIMLLHVGAGPNLLMSIPRDSLVDIPGHGRTKINAAFAYGGPKLLVQTVEDSTGIHIDHYVEIGFGGFVNVVDAVGGIQICPTRNMKDKLANLDIKKGCQQADGGTALGYARSRHTDPQYGDITRAQHQREVVSAVGKKAVSPWSVLNPVRYVRLNLAAADSLRVSRGTSSLAMARFAWAMTRVSGDKGLTCTVPLQSLAVEWDPTRSEAMFARIIKDDTEHIGKSLCTPHGLPR